ncbi:MAG: GNAT family N-acetyltransferase [Desulfobacterales bacterium]|nr:GNAT family N-acetyltransferase [Desulfobacterales bacterium]
MTKTVNWADNYQEKKRSPKEAIALIRPGQRVFIGSSCGEPQALMRALADQSEDFTGLEIVRLMALESAPLTLAANKSGEKNLTIRSFYAGSGRTRGIARNLRYITPMNLSAVPRLFKTKRMPINVALIQVSEPDDFGWVSLGISVDITLAAARSADLVIAQVNPRMPRVMGRSFIHANDIDVAVEVEEPLLTVGAPPESESANLIADHIKGFVEDGATIQISLGTTPQAVLRALADKNDLGIHTQYVTDDIMHLVSRGVITNRFKGYNDGKLVASSAIGSEELYEYLDDNPGIDFYPSDYVNDPSVIARHHRMVSINVAMEIDLTGQVAADAMPINHFTGVSGMLDFIRGAAQAENGKSILMLTAASRDGKKSRIVPMLTNTAAVIPRSDVHYVVTEFGAVNLFGKSLQERALAMISIAHPAFRDRLFYDAKKLGLLGTDRRLKESIHSVYPIRLEKRIEIDGESVMIRPAKPVDERRIQEHFYNLEAQDVVSRFFHEKSTFARDEVEGLSQIDYIKNLTLVAVVGEFGFGRVVGVAEYLLDESTNMAEVAFSISRGYQQKGLGRLLMEQMSRAALENGIAGFLAYIAPDNQGMHNLFNTLPYRVDSEPEEDVLLLRCRFDDPKPETESKESQ